MDRVKSKRGNLTLVKAALPHLPGPRPMLTAKYSTGSPSVLPVHVTVDRRPHPTPASIKVGSDSFGGEVCRCAQPFQIQPTVAIRRRAATTRAARPAPARKGARTTATGTQGLGDASLFRHRPWLRFPRRRRIESRGRARSVAVPDAQGTTQTCLSQRQRSHDMEAGQRRASSSEKRAAPWRPCTRAAASRTGGSGSGGAVRAPGKDTTAWRGSRGQPARPPAAGSARVRACARSLCLSGTEGCSFRCGPSRVRKQSGRQENTSACMTARKRRRW